MDHTYTVLHLFSGIGGAALGMQETETEYRGVKANFVTLGGVDCDQQACRDFEMLTGAPAFCMDLFSWDDYIAFHGKEPPVGWREVSPEDLLKATGGICPDVIFLSPPCKGFSGLLPSKSAKSEKYQALNRLTVRGLRLVLEAFKDDPPGIILLENVPRITSRGASLLDEIKRLLKSYGYLIHEGYHDCGELGGLGQQRKRYLLKARQPEKVKNFVYLPPKLRFKSIGEVIGPLPMPGDPAGGPMHRLPRLQWKTWVRLALIPAGGDWRDLEKIAPEQYRLEHVPRSNAFGVQDWDKTANTVTGADGPNNATVSIVDPRISCSSRPGLLGVADWDKPISTVTGSASVTCSNGVAAISDPRLTDRDGRHPGVYRVVKFDEPGPCVTGTRFGSGAPAVADPRLSERQNRRSNSYIVRPWDGQALTITGEDSLGSGAQSIADPRMGCKARSGTMGVMAWDNPGKTVIGAGDIHSGAAAVADPRVPKDNEQGTWIITAEDG